MQEAVETISEAVRPVNQAANLTGKKFGRYTAIARAKDAESNGRKERRWLCLCECGIKKVVRVCNLNSGKSTSCGCFQRENMGNVKRTHGRWHTSEYWAWRSMKQRCHNPNAYNYKNYGGRGITVCSRWRNSFQGFFADMGERPDAKLTLERIDNNGNYTPANCIWASNASQSRNRRNNRIVTIDGVSKCVAEWSDKAGVNRCTIISRLKRGWAPRRAIQPI